MNNISKEEMKLLLKEVMRSELGDLYVDRQQHFLDHEQLKKCRDYEELEKRQKNHDFVSAVRHGSDIAKMAIIRTSITALIVFIGGAIVYYIKAIITVK